VEARAKGPNIESRKQAAGTHGQPMKAEDSRQADTDQGELARNAGMTSSGAETDVTTRLRTKAERERESGLMNAVCERGNLKLAYQRVVENKGAAGVDLLTELDRELERRGHAFCRYADDCNIYVRKQQAGERVMASITRFLADTAQAHGQCGQECGRASVEEAFLGYSLTWHKPQDCGLRRPA